MKLTISEVERIDKFYCNDCENKFNLLTSWKGRVATGRLLEFKNKHYHQVEEILQCRTKYTVRGTTRKFLVKWKDYDASHNSWLPEDYLDGCLDMLQRFLRDKSLPVSTLHALLGDTNSEVGNEKNWVPMERILSKISSMRNIGCYKTTLECTAFEKIGTGDKIYVIAHDRHCYVLLYLANKHRGFIADGRNNFIDDTSVQSELKSLLEIDLIGVKYDYQFRADQCATSAVMIALEFMRAYKKGWIPVKLYPPKALTNRVASDFHKFLCASLDNRPSDQKVSSAKKCTLCDWTCRKTGNKGLNLHMIKKHKA